MAKLVRFSGSPKVYDISGGTFEWIPTIEEFNKRGLSFDDVKIINKADIKLNRNENEFKVFATIDGQQVHVQDEATFGDIGFDFNDVNVIKEKQTQPKQTQQQAQQQTQPNRNQGLVSPSSLSDNSLKDTKKVTEKTAPLNQETQQFTQTGFEAKTDNELWAWHQELSDSQQLYQVYLDRPDLQEVFDSNLQGKLGTDWEGFSLSFWANQWGWREDPIRLEAYKPENMVRSRYRFGFRGKDPFAEGSFDEGALDWVQGVKDGVMTTYDGLLGKMQLDAGGEWKDLPDTTKNQLIIDAAIEREALANIPKFADFFKEEEVKLEVDKKVDEFYQKQFDNYLEERGIAESRTIEDYTKLIGSIDEEKERELTDTQLQFRAALGQATEAYGRSGLAFSSIRRESETQLREGLARGKGRITTAAKEQKKKADKTKKRTLEDLARDEKLKREAIGKGGTERLFKSEERLTQKRGQALVEHQILKDEALGI